MSQSCTTIPAPTKPRNFKVKLAEPQTKGERKLFAQYLWNAGVLMAELIGSDVRGEDTSPEPNRWAVNGESLGTGCWLAYLYRKEITELLLTPCVRHWPRGYSQPASRSRTGCDI